MSILLPGAAVALLTLVAVVLLASPTRVRDEHNAALLAARRHEDHTALASLLGVVAAVVLLVTGTSGPLLHLDPPGLLGALSLTAGAVIFLAIHYVGQYTWPRPVGHIRQASLRRRSIRQLAGRRAVLLLATAAVLTCALAIFGLTADDSGRAVPHLITSEAAAQGSLGGASGPYPGWPYALPLLGAFAVVLLATFLVLRLVARRPAVAGTRDADDHALRLTSARRVLGGAQLFLGGTGAAVLLLATVSLNSAGWWLAALITGPLGLAIGLGSVLLAATALPPTATTPTGTTPDRADAAR